VRFSLDARHGTIGCRARSDSADQVYNCGVCGPFVHQVDPVIGEIASIYLWWYGASYTLGLLGAFFWIKRVRASLSYDLRSVYALTIFLCLGVLLGGRIVEVLFYEWSYYRDHLWHIAAIWIGGMSTHGVLLGAAASVWLFCRSRGKEFLPIADQLAIAGAYIMGMGRLGNFIDGQIAGSITDVCWAVQFPDLEGFRHPVVLYDGLKNLLLVPVLLYISSRRPPRGVVLGHFILWYGFLRIFVDLFREYRTDLLGLPPGQEFNMLMSIVGLALIAWAHKTQSRERTPGPTRGSSKHEREASWLQRISLAVLVAIPLIIPSDWTQDVPERYGARHEGMKHSIIYPKIPKAAPE
jgi:phosphatidylglycerol:prolipoprotein diacylglycerol transferase